MKDTIDILDVVAITADLPERVCTEDSRDRGGNPGPPASSRWSFPTTRGAPTLLPRSKQISY